MKKLSFYFFIVLIFFNTAFAQSLLPECEDNNKNISEFSANHFSMVRKWTNCHGTAIGSKGEKYVVNFITENFMDKELSQKMVENMLENIKIIKDMVRVHILMPMVINT